MADRDFLEARKCSTSCSSVGCLSQMLSFDEVGEGGAGGEVAMAGEGAQIQVCESIYVSWRPQKLVRTMVHLNII